MKFTGLLDGIVKGKTYLSRSLGYLSLFNSAVLIFLLLSNLEKYGIDVELRYWVIPIVILCIILLILGGWVEDKLGVWKKEQQFAQERNPQVTEILKEVKHISKEVAYVKEEVEQKR